MLDVDRDAQGNIRVAEIDLGRKVKSEVQLRLERRGIKVTVVDKTIGYELRCAPPIPFDAEYARDLGYAAFKHLYDGGPSALITTQGGESQAVPLEQVLDPATGRGRQRFVDVDTESYQVARDYMMRIGPKDFRDDAWTQKLADAGGLTREEFTARFGYPEVKIGFVPAMVMAILRRNVSEKRAFELATRGAEIGAEEAERLGLVNRIFDDARFEAALRSNRLTQQLAAGRQAQ